MQENSYGKDIIELMLITRICVYVAWISWFGNTFIPVVQFFAAGLTWRVG
jgi:hypothetical protein